MGRARPLVPPAARRTGATRSERPGVRVRPGLALGSPSRELLEGTSRTAARSHPPFPVHRGAGVSRLDPRLHRERGRLINERIQHVNRIKGLLAIHGIYDYPPLRHDRMQQLEGLRTADGRTLSPRLKAEILRELQRLELVIGMIKTIEAERDAIASAKIETEHGSAKRIQDLAKIKCIGPEFATTLVGEVFYCSFDNRKQLASYVGLTPAHFQSGETCRDQGISKAGNAKARRVMIELAWLWLRHQPASPLSVWFHDRVGKLKGRIRRITIVAVARKLLIALWRYLETGLAPEGAILKV